MPCELQRARSRCSPASERRELVSTEPGSVRTSYEARGTEIIEHIVLRTVRALVGHDEVTPPHFIFGPGPRPRAGRGVIEELAQELVAESPQGPGGLIAGAGWS